MGGPLLGLPKSVNLCRPSMHNYCRCKLSLYLIPTKSVFLQARETVIRCKSVLVFFANHPPCTAPPPSKVKCYHFVCAFFHLSVLTTTKMTPTVCPQRTTSGQCCIIPFTYKGETYNSCTDADHHRLWCSLDSHYKGRWGNCRKYDLMTQ